MSVSRSIDGGNGSEASNEPVTESGDKSADDEEDDMPRFPVVFGLKVRPDFYAPKAKNILTLKFKRQRAIGSGETAEPQEMDRDDAQNMYCKITGNQLEAMKTQSGRSPFQQTVPWENDYVEETSCVCGAHNKFELVTNALDRGMKPLQIELQQIKDRMKDIDMSEPDAYRELQHDSSAKIQEQPIYQEEIAVQALPPQPCPYAPQPCPYYSPPTPPSNSNADCCSCEDHSEEPEDLNTQMYTPPQQETGPAISTAQYQSNRRVFIPGVNLFSNTSNMGYQNQDQPRMAREVLTLPGVGIYIIPPEQPQYCQPSRMSDYGVRQQDNNTGYEHRGSQDARQVFQPELNGMQDERSAQQKKRCCCSDNVQGEMYDKPAASPSPLDPARSGATRSSTGYSNAPPQQSENGKFFHGYGESITCQCQQMGMQSDGYDEGYQMGKEVPVERGGNSNVSDIPSQEEKIVPASPPEGDSYMKSLPPATPPLDGPRQSVWCDPEDIKNLNDSEEAKSKVKGSSMKKPPNGPACLCKDE